MTFKCHLQSQNQAKTNPHLGPLAKLEKHQQGELAQLTPNPVKQQGGRIYSTST